MGKKDRVHSKHNTDEEFPILGNLGLYAGEIHGDGNCLFRALSDQLYGTQNEHPQIRKKVVSYIKQHRERFEPFAAAYADSFDEYVDRMSQDATYGGHQEIVAFAEAYHQQVIIYQSDRKYAVNPTDGDAIGRIHIAYHTWEHYSSVRNKKGPHSGVPAVEPEPIDSPIELPKAADGHIPKWKIAIVQRAVPGVSEERIERLLAKKDYADVIEDLLMEGGEEEPQQQEPAANADQVAPETAGSTTTGSEAAGPNRVKEKRKKVSKSEKKLHSKWAKKKLKAAAKTVVDPHAHKPKTGSSNKEDLGDTIFI